MEENSITTENEKNDHFCVKCHCLGWNDTDGDGRCNTPRMDHPDTECGHERRDHN